MKVSSKLSLIIFLLVVIVIIGLVKMAYPVLESYNKEQKTRAKVDSLISHTDCQNLALSINNFISDHQGEFPVDTLANLSENKAISTDIDDPANMISILMDSEQGPEQDHINRSGQKYVSARFVDERRGGIYTEGHRLGFYDPWGKPYYVILDVNGDEEIKDPMAKKNQDKSISSRVIVYGTGLDGAGSQKDHKIQDPKYNSDNPCSWKRN